MKKLVLFDFDLTLVDASKGIIIATHQALSAMGKSLPTGDEVRSTIGLPLEKMYTVFTGSNAVLEQEQFKKLFVEEADEVVTQNTVFFPDAVHVLQSLKEKGYQVGIVSTKYRYRIEEVLCRDELMSLVNFVIGGDDVKAYKPSPEGILMAMKKANVTADEVLFVGDTLMDQGAAQNAGVDFMAVLNGTTQGVDFLQVGVKAESIVVSLTEMLEALLQLE